MNGIDLCIKCLHAVGKYGIEEEDFRCETKGKSLLGWENEKLPS